MRHDQTRGTEVALVPAGGGRPGARFGDRDRGHHDSAELVAPARGDPCDRVHRSSLRPGGPTGAGWQMVRQRQRQIIASLRLASNGCGVAALVIAIVWWFV